MLNLAALLDRSSRVIPTRSAWIEAFGFFILGVGLFLGLAEYSFNPSDYPIQTSQVTNLAGPLGAWMSLKILGNFGVIGMFWPLLFALWGILITFGFALAPKPRRIIGLVALMLFSAAICEIQLSSMQVFEPSFGFGGHFGRAIGHPVYRAMGYGGSLIFLSIMVFISLALTGNIAFSRTKSNLIYAESVGVKVGKKAYYKLFEKPKSDEELIRDALAAEVRKSRTLGKKRNGVADDPPAKGSGGKKSDSQKSQEKLADLVNDVLDSVEAERSSNPANVSSGNVDANGEEINFYYTGGNHEKPRANLFTRSTKAKVRTAEFEKMGKKLTHQLAQFKIDGAVKKISEGPVVTTLEFEPVAGTKMSKITALSQDLARMLQATSIRILAPIPGKRTCGFEIPNEERRMIGFADFVEHKDLKAAKIQLPIAMGLDAFGDPVIEDLAKMPHLLVAGSTGSGKSVFMNSLIASLVCRHSAKDLRFIMVDPKMVELAAYNGLPHMACPVVSDPSAGAKAKLDALVKEMEDRFRKMQIVGARNLQSFNEIIKKSRKTEFPKFEDKWQTMPFIVLIIDELADMMMVLGKDVEIPITRLAQKARAAGIHLVIATQRPSAEVVTGLIKANFPTRVAFRVLSGLDSRTILDQNGAEGLLGQGDMLYMSAGGVRRIHGAYLSEEEVQKMVKATK